MLYLYKLQLNNKEVKIRTQDKINESELEDIQRLLTTIQREANHNISGSSSFRFNEAGVNIQQHFEAIFLEFLQINIKLSQSYFPRFSSFKPIFFNDSIVLTDEVVSKKIDIVLDTSYLRTSFAIEYIKRFIIQNIQIDSFCIEHDSFFSAYGKKEWIISHHLIKNAYGINNESIYITPYSFSNNIGKNFFPDAIIFISDDLFTNKIESLILPELSSVDEYKNYCEENSTKIVFVSDNLSLEIGF